MTLQVHYKSGDPVEGREAFSHCVAEWVSNAEREVLLITQQLDSRLYGSSETYSAFKNFSLNHQRATVQVLVQNGKQASQGGCRLIELGQRVSSRFAFRAIPQDERDCQSELLIVDGSRYLYRHNPDNLTAYAITDDPLHSRQQADTFKEWWQHASPSQELRNLHI